MEATEAVVVTEDLAVDLEVVSEATEEVALEVDILALEVVVTVEVVTEEATEVAEDSEVKLQIENVSK